MPYIAPVVAYVDGSGRLLCEDRAAIEAALIDLNKRCAQR
jgi:hypothetical protein